MFILLSVLMLAGCGGEPSAPSPASSPPAPSATEMTGVTVETGGMALPPTAPGEGAPATAPLSPTATEAPLLPMGAAITATASVTLYAEPDGASPRFAQYAAGSRFTVIEPDGDWTAYPVAVEGQLWYRVRAEDGLVGWVMEDALYAP